MFVKLKNLHQIKKRKGGRNNQGRITIWHRGGGSCLRNRFLNYKPDLLIGEKQSFGIGKIRQHSALIELVCSEFGFFSYVFAPREAVTHKDKMLLTTNFQFKLEPFIRLRFIPLGTSICNIELKPNAGGQLSRAAGTYSRLMFKKFISGGVDFAGIVTRKKKIIYVPLDSRAYIGVIPNTNHSAINWLKAGTSRKRGYRPVVRGVAMNPIDHPHGGGEGKSSGGRCSVTPWGKLTKGFKTVKRKKLLKYKLLVSKMNKIL